MRIIVYYLHINFSIVYEDPVFQNKTIKKFATKVSYRQLPPRAVAHFLGALFSKINVSLPFFASSGVFFSTLCAFATMSHCYFTRLKCTEVRRAPLIHFQKIFFKKGFYRSKLARELKFYAWIIIEGSKSLKKSQKTLKKATNLV